MKILFTILALSVAVSAQVAMNTLHTFTNTPDGHTPYTALAPDGKGNFYGTTEYGGQYGLGEVFEILKNGKEKTIYSFPTSQLGGRYPLGTLRVDADGNLWGTTELGGEKNCGVVFELIKTGSQWSETVIYNFLGANFGDDGIYDGEVPRSGVIADANGNLYGTTFEGGKDYAGTVYELVNNGNGQWSEQILYNATAGTNNSGEIASGVTMDSAGNLYSTTASQPFQLAAGTWAVTMLHTFSGKTLYELNGTLVIGANGVLYGTTTQGGHGHGIVYSLTPPKIAKNGKSNDKWTGKTLYSFVATKGSTDGNGPFAGLTLGPNGVLYGATLAGGTLGLGTVYELTPQANGSYQETILWNFDNGRAPAGGLVIDPSGNLFGTTAAGGGEYGGGTVFEISGANP